MDEYIVQDSIGMTRGSSLRIDDGIGILIYVWEGVVWLTQDGSTKDHVLHAGEQFRLDRDGAAIAHSFRRSVLTLSAAEPEPYARRIALTRAGADTSVELYDAGKPFFIGTRLVHALRKIWKKALGPLDRATEAWG